MSKSLVGFLVRFGFIVRGVLYILTGLYGFVAAIGLNSGTKDTFQIVNMLGGTPFGKIFLILLFIGFVGYGIWGIIRALRNNDFFVRIGYLISGLSYLFLSLIPLDLFFNLSVVDSNNYQNTALFLFRLPGGTLSVVVIGLIIIAGGIGQIIYSVQGKFKKSLQPMKSYKKEEILVSTGKFGYLVRGLIFSLIGFFFLKAGITGNASQVKDPGQILFWSWQQNGGSFMLGAISIGLVALGIYSIFTSRLIKLTINEKN